jgi:hypothetical protein
MSLLRTKLTKIDRNETLHVIAHLRTLRYCDVPRKRDKKLMGSEIDEAICWISNLQLQLQLLKINVFHTLQPD